MNREIEFRGFSKTDKCYVYSSLNLYITGDRKSDPLITNFEGTQSWSVHPESLRQYTGLKDKNGKEIYKGDIERFYWNPILNQPSEIYTMIAPIIYYNEWACFCYHFTNKSFRKPQNDMFHDYSDDERFVAVGTPMLCDIEVEVLGNIYQNPELLRA